MSNNREKYLSFYNDLANYLDKNHSSICFYGYGSCFNEPRANPSDLDGGLISPRIITNKRAILDISFKMLTLAREKGVPYSENTFQFNFLDVLSGRDGRFLSYSSPYTLFLKKYGKVLAGPNFLKELNGTDNRYEALNSFAHNFRGVRNDFLHSAYYLQQGKVGGRLEKLKTFLEGCPKKIRELDCIKQGKYPHFIEELYKRSKKDFINQFRRNNCRFDMGGFNRIISFNKANLDFLSQRELITLWGDGLEAFESFVALAIKKNSPKVIEAKTVI